MLPLGFGKGPFVGGLRGFRASGSQGLRRKLLRLQQTKALVLCLSADRHDWGTSVASAGQR